MCRVGGLSDDLEVRGELLVLKHSLVDLSGGKGGIGQG